MATKGITVIDVFRALGLEPEKTKTWAVGAAVAKLYLKDRGELPPKDNRVKTSGSGVHCFAIYPESYRQKIKDCIGRMKADATKQPEFI
jgi:hypothetical protein